MKALGSAHGHPAGVVEAYAEGAGGQQPEAVEAFAGRGLIRYSGVGAQDRPARLALKLPSPRRAWSWIAASRRKWKRMTITRAFLMPAHLPPPARERMPAN